MRDFTLDVARKLMGLRPGRDLDVSKVLAKDRARADRLVEGTRAAEARLLALSHEATERDALEALGNPENTVLRNLVGGPATGGSFWQARGELGGWNFYSTGGSPYNTGTQHAKRKK